MDNGPEPLFSDGCLWKAPDFREAVEVVSGRAVESDARAEEVGVVAVGGAEAAEVRFGGVSKMAGGLLWFLKIEKQIYS